MSEKKEPERAHLQDRPHPYCVRRPVATTATSYGLSWSERRAEQTRVGDRPGRFVPSGDKPAETFSPPYRRIATVGKKAIMWGRRRKREGKKKEEREEEGEVCGILDALEVSLQLFWGGG